MEKSWWWKTIGVFLLTVLAVIYVLPSVVGNKLPAWYSKKVKAQLQLGLDLQGGIHLVYEVLVDKAVSDKADRLAGDLEKRLKDEKKLHVTVIREKRDDIVITFKKPSDVKVLDKKFMYDFESSLEEKLRDDAKGMVHFRMDGDYVAQVQDYAVRQALETIRGRVDEFGVAEPSIMGKGRDIVVELPGLTEKDFERVKKQIGRTAQLEFRICDDDSDYMNKVALKVPKDGPIEVQDGSHEKGKKGGTSTYKYLESKDKKALLAFLESLPGQGLPLPKGKEIALGEEVAKDKKGNPLPDKVWITYLVRNRAELTGEYVTDAEVQYDNQTGRPEVSLTFDRTGGEIFAKVSGDNVGERMAILLENKVNSAPVLQERIGGGRARITLGGMMDVFKMQEEAKDLVGVLRSGALPAPLNKTFERQVGPTLGKDSIRKGILAFMIGGGLVVLFMLYYYRGAG
ncbi:MAG: preprotein translocase subunit SecD, partial [Pseudomonadota bacterium]